MTTAPCFGFAAREPLPSESLLQHFPHQVLLLRLKFLVGHAPLRMEVGERAELGYQVRFLMNAAGWGGERGRAFVPAPCYQVRWERDGPQQQTGQEPAEWPHVEEAWARSPGDPKTSGVPKNPQAAGEHDEIWQEVDHLVQRPTILRFGEGFRSCRSLGLSGTFSRLGFLLACSQS